MLPISLALVMTVALVVRLVSVRMRKFRTTSGEIRSIDPHFTRHSPLKTGAVACRYVFRARDRDFEGRVVLPLSFFLRPGAPATPVVVFDGKIELPILFYGKQRLVGAELIEHLLLQKNQSIPIRYLQRDPSRHSVVVAGDSEKTRSARNIKSSDVL